MRGLGIFNMYYGAAGIASADYLGMPEGVAVALWVTAIGAAAYFGVGADVRRMARNALRRLVGASA